MNISSILKEDFEYIRHNYDFSFLNGKSVFVTGATGLLGKQLCLYLLYLNEKNDANIKIFALVRSLEKSEKTYGAEFCNPGIKFVNGDVLSFRGIEERLAGEEIDFVIHGASITSSKDFISHAVETIDTAVNGTLNLLRFANSKNAEGFVYLSSMEAFGITDGSGEVREKDLGYIDISSPRSSYMESKRMCENLCACFAAEYNLDVKTVRLTQTFGPGVSYEDTRVAAYFSRCVIENEDIVLKTEGKTRRPVLYTRDAVSAILTVLKNGSKGDVYTAANPETFVTIKETAEMIVQKIAGGKIKLLFEINNPAEYAPNLNLNLNVDKLSAAGWSPSVGLEEAYRRMIAEMRGKRESVFSDNLNPVCNIENLIKKYFKQNLSVKNKSVTNNCIGALVYKNNFAEFKINFNERLKRISEKIQDEEQRKEIVNKIKNLAETTGYKWAGAYSELVALDFFLNCNYLEDFKFINKLCVKKYPNSFVERNGGKTIDIDFSFRLKGEIYYMDIKSLIPTQIEVFDEIIDDVIKEVHPKKIIVGVDELKPENILTFQKLIDNERESIKSSLLDAINNNEKRVVYSSKNGNSYNFNISYDGFLSTEQIKEPYKMAKFDNYKFLNYSNKLLNSEYSLLTFVINPWFNNQINDFNGFNKIYYRSVSRRVFIEFKNDKTPLQNIFKNVKDQSITISDVSTSIAGIFFIEDKSVKRDTDNILYKGYLYLNPNYKKKIPLSKYDFSSYFENFSISKMIEIDDFADDNY